MADREFYSGKILYPVTLALLVLSLLFGFAILPRLFGAPEGALAGKPAPDFTLKVVANGDKPTLSLHDLAGSAVVLDFWATWCGPCQAEAPIVNKVAQRFHDRGLVVVGVDTDDQDGKAHAWALAHGLTYPIVFDEGDRVAGEYGVSSMPTLIVVSRAGKVLAVRQGMTDDSELEDLVKQAL
jgi:cytochrome c biogenesis protein CcmG, thiol:disulfide interchange protein DsbE